MRSRFFTFVLALPVCIGCAASIPAVTYTPPEEHLVNTIVHVEEPFATVWNRLIKGLSRAGLLIEKETEAEGKITIAFSTDASHEYVNCGSVVYGTEKKVEMAKATRRTSRSSSYARKTFLEGRVHITVEREDGLTLVSLKPVYELSVEARSANYGWREKRVMTPTITDSEGVVIAGGDTKVERSRKLTRRSRGTRAIVFVTNTPNEANWGSSDEPMYVNCCSTGKVEELILALARRFSD